MRLRESEGEKDVEKERESGDQRQAGRASDRAGSAMHDRVEKYVKTIKWTVLFVHSVISFSFEGRRERY